MTVSDLTGSSGITGLLRYSYQVETPVSCVFGLFLITGSHLVSIEMKGNGNWYVSAALRHSD